MEELTYLFYPICHIYGYRYLIEWWGDIGGLMLNRKAFCSQSLLWEEGLFLS